jgi:hypothetical protein
MSNYKSHALTEFRAAGWLKEDGTYTDEMQQLICEHVLKLLEVFADEQHSGSSAPYTISLFSILANFDPIVPLTGEDWEWNEITDERTGGVSVHQNKRCGAVFKQSDRFDGQPYYLDAVVFWEWNSNPNIYDGKPFKSYFTGRDSMQPITFPYTPKTEYKFLPTPEFPNEVLS